ncbi:MAG: hypothetical protein VKJ64_08720 [Leptolyngbyaceae bacterium]|nr:hypothetical protein [Leptolyngbyaceae bacterium]
MYTRGAIAPLLNLLTSFMADTDPILLVSSVSLGIFPRGSASALVQGRVRLAAANFALS